MSNYTKTTDFEAKDSLPTGDSGKIIRGAEFETEFDAISTAIATKADTAGPTFTGTLTFETISDGTIGVTAFVDEDDMSSDSATLVPTQQSVKAYVDAQVTAQDLDFQADTGGALSIDLDSETLTFTGGTGIDTSGSGNAVTFAIDSTVATLTGTQTLTNKTLTSPDVNTPDIDGGTIDGTVIGGTTAAAGSFTTVSATGNITVDGTVDGRDVATDGTKLDGIESGATADQTAAEIRTLVDSATDSNVFTDADHSKLDGIEAGADVTDTTNVTAAGAVMDSELTNETAVKALNQGVATTDSPTFAGLTTTANVSFGDNDKIQMGAGPDLEIYHDGTSTNYISSATSNLEIKVNGGGNFKVGDEFGNHLFIVNDNGDVQLKHGSTPALKLATTSTGIDVTGTVTADGLTVDGATVLDIGDEGTLQVGPTTTGADENQTIEMRGSNGSNELQRFQIANRGEDGRVDFKYGRAGATPTKAISIGSGTGDISFYEDTGTTAKLFWDASAESLGIGTSSPSAPLHIGKSGAAAELWLQRTDGYNPVKLFGSTLGDGQGFKINVNSNDAFAIDSSGNVGIGTSSPSTRLSVRAGSANGIELDQDSDLATDSARLFFNSSSGGYSIFNTSGSLRFSSGATAGSSSGTERMRIDSSGNVGIGTSATAVSNYKVLHVQSGHASAGGYIRLQTNVATEYANIYSFNNSLYKDADTQIFQNKDASTEYMRIDSSGNLLVGVTSAQDFTSTTTNGHTLYGGTVNAALHSRSGNAALAVQRTTNDGAIVNFFKDTTQVGSMGTDSGAFVIHPTVTIGTGLWMDADHIEPAQNDGTRVDDSRDFGSSSYRWDDIYATNGTIQTSDRNEKQDIEALSDAEQRVAVACKGLLRKFRWKSSVAENGDEARIHFGIIAQDLQAAFEAEGLDAGRYAMFINSTWTDEETGEERTRMGVRYSELLAFIIAAI